MWQKPVAVLQLYEIKHKVQLQIKINYQFRMKIMRIQRKFLEKIWCDADIVSIQIISDIIGKKRKQTNSVVNLDDPEELVSLGLISTKLLIHLQKIRAISKMKLEGKSCN